MNDLQVYQRIENPIQAAAEMGRAMSASGMFGLKNPEAGMVVALTCLCEGITPIDFGRTYHLIMGRPSMRSDAMLAEFRKAGGTHKVLSRTPELCAVELSFKGQTAEFSLSWEECEKEDFSRARNERTGEILWDTPKDNYAYPRKRMQMMWARVISDGVRTLTPEIVAGVYTPEETEDFIEGEIVAKPAALSPADAIAKAASLAVQETEAEAVVDAEYEVPFGTSNDVQIAKLDMLRKKLELSDQEWAAALHKRSVTDVRQLSAEQADELILRMEARLAKK